MGLQPSMLDSMGLLATNDSERGKGVSLSCLIRLLPALVF
jgi:hypothetical protein